MTRGFTRATRVSFKDACAIYPAPRAASSMRGHRLHRRLVVKPQTREELQARQCTRCQDFIEYKHAIPAHALTYMSKRNSGGCLGIGRPQGPPKGPENGPRGPPHGPSGSQNGPKRPQEDGPKRDPIGPQGSPKRALRRPNKERSPKRAPRDLSPRGPCECHDSRLVIVLFAACGRPD